MKNPTTLSVLLEIKKELQFIRAVLIPEQCKTGADPVIYDVKKESKSKKLNKPMDEQAQKLEEDIKNIRKFLVF